MDVDPSGTLVLAGISFGPIDFGNGPVGKQSKSYDDRNLIVVGFDAGGQRQFAFAKDTGFAYTGSISLRAVASGQIVVAGATTVSSEGSYPSTKYTLTWPCGSAPASIGQGIEFVVAFDSSGNCLWDHTYPADAYSQYPTSIAALTDGSIVTSGQHQTVPRPTRRFTGGAQNWQKPYGGSALGALSTGRAVIANYYWLEQQGEQATLLMAELDASGSILASKKWGTGAFDLLQFRVGLDVAADDRLALAIHYTGTVDLGGGPMTSTAGGTGPSKIFASLGPEFSHVFSRSIDLAKSDSGSTDESDTFSVATSSKLVYVGQFWRSAEFGTGPLQAVGTSDTDFDIFVASYAADGTPLLARRFGGPDYDSVTAVTSDASGAVYAAGTYRTSVDFGDGTHQNPEAASEPPTPATYLVKLRP